MGVAFWELPISVYLGQPSELEVALRSSGSDLLSISEKWELGLSSVEIGVVFLTAL